MGTAAPQPLNRMTAEERLVYEVLQEHRGEGNAIKQHDMAGQIQIGKHAFLSTRKAREIIGTLIIKYWVPIGSSPGPNPGYYIATSGDEITRACGRLRKQALKMLNREAALKKMTLNKLMENFQMELRFE